MKHWPKRRYSVWGDRCTTSDRGGLSTGGCDGIIFPVAAVTHSLAPVIKIRSGIGSVSRADLLVAIAGIFICGCPRVGLSLNQRGRDRQNADERDHHHGGDIEVLMVTAGRMIHNPGCIVTRLELCVNTCYDIVVPMSSPFNRREKAAGLVKSKTRIGNSNSRASANAV